MIQSLILIIKRTMRWIKQDMSQLYINKYRYDGAFSKIYTWPCKISIALYL